MSGLLHKVDKFKFILNNVHFSGNRSPGRGGRMVPSARGRSAFGARHAQTARDGFRAPHNRCKKQPFPGRNGKKCPGPEKIFLTLLT